MRTLIANGEAGMRAQLHRLYADRFDGPQAIEVTQDWPPQIIGEKSGRIYFLDIHNVAYLASAGNYVAAHLGGDEFLTRATLKSMSVVLSPLGFIQIQRSLLVNLRQVVHVERCDRGQFCFVMRNGDRLVSSRERSGSIRALLLGATLPHRL
jgi:DNA-binding LytR/AlgR family response regulator